MVNLKRPCPRCQGTGEIPLSDRQQQEKLDSQDWLRRYRAGETAQAIADIYGVSKRTVHRGLRKAGITETDRGTHAQRRYEKRYGKWGRQYRAGETAQAIADADGVSYQAVQQGLRKIGVKGSEGGQRVKIQRRAKEWAERYTGGESVASIAQSAGVSRSPVYEALRIMGVPRQAAARCPGCATPWDRARKYRCPGCGLTRYRADPVFRKHTLARGRALTRLVKEHRTDYRRLYEKNGHSQSQVRAALRDKYRNEYNRYSQEYLAGVS